VTRRRRARRGEGERLREEILAAADRLLVQTACEEAVSVRAIGAAVGVSPPAIYLHFADKAELLFAVCERHFAALDAATDAAAASAPADDQLEALRRRGRAYIRFGVDNPSHYRILFMGGAGADPSGWTPERLLASSAFGHLVDNVRRAMDTGALAYGDAHLVATGLWAAVHGVASLLIAKPHFPWPDVDALVDHVLATQVRGLAATAADDTPSAPNGQSVRGR
jgi:AcrR family transcriptional regulator